MPEATRYQGFCFTHNNWTQKDWDRYVGMYEKSLVTHLIIGKECGEKTHTEHLQGWFWTTTPQTLQNMKKKCPRGVVFVPGKLKGPDHWRTYCSKQDKDMVELGIPPTEEAFLAQCAKGRGARTDLLEIKEKIDNGVNCTNLIGESDHFATFAVHEKFFHRYQAHKRRRLTFEKPTVIVYYGETGANKTRRVYDQVVLDEFYCWQPGNGPWFDGYLGQDTVLFDEFRGQLPFGTMLSLLDGYPGRKVPVKGSFVDWSPKNIFITSPLHPRDWYPDHFNNAKDSYSQLKRRIDRIEHCVILSGQPGCSTD